MTHDNVPAYGLWSLVIINSLVFIIFAFSFAKPQSGRDWRSFSAFSSFLAQTGAYARVRHPQFVAFVLIMFGFLLQWPTVLTLVMFPILCTMYVRLSITEEREAAKTFGAEWDRYASQTPRFVPKIGASGPTQHHA